MFFIGPIQQLNRLSKKLSDGKILTKIVDSDFCNVPARKGGEPARFIKLDDGRFSVDIANPAEIKQGGLLISLHGIGKTKIEAAKDYLNRIKDGMTIVVFGNERSEFLAKRSKLGLKIVKLNLKA